MTIQFTSCKKCGKAYLVGIDGKDITKAETSGGNVMIDGLKKTPFMAIGNDQIENAPKLSLEIPCKNCGTICKVKGIKGLHF